MYRDEILDHYRKPRNTGSLDTGKNAEGENPSCGDDTHVFLKVEDDKVEKMKHETDACAVCTAAISILSQELPGKKIEEVRELNQDWMLEKLGIEVSPMRMKCAMLGLKTTKKALEK